MKNCHTIVVARGTVLLSLLSLLFLLSATPVRADGDIDTMINSIVEGTEVAPADGSYRFYLEGIMQFAPRLTGTPNAAAAAGYLETTFMGMGYYNVSVQPWSLGGFSGDNIIAERPGTGPDPKIYILCAHYDTREFAPGADDNGSGTAALLAVAKAIESAGMTFPHTIRFVAFSGEEQGELGSAFYASQARSSGEEIAAVFNYDMAGYYDLMIDSESNAKLRIYENFESQWLTLFLSGVASDTEYATDIGLTVTPTAPNPLADNHPASDHQSFWNQFYSAIGLHEQVQNPHYHQPTDTIAHMIPEYATRVTRLAAAGLAEAARNGVGTPYQDFVCLAVLPQIDTISPEPAFSGQSVLISGMNFAGPPCLYDVTFNLVSTQYTFINGSTIQATVPPALSGTVEVRVHVHVGGTSEPYTLQVNTGSGPCQPMLTPLLLDVTPNPVAPGDLIWLDGGFQPQPCTTQVTFDDMAGGVTDATFTWVEPGTIVARVPDGLADGTYQVQVIQANSEMSGQVPVMVDSSVGAICLTVLPTIEAAAPPVGFNLTPVSIIGTFFQPPPCLLDVKFGGTSSPAFLWVNYHHIVALVPENIAGWAPIEVVISGGGTSAPYPFEVIERPYRRGDANDSGSIDIADVIHTLGYLFPTGPGNLIPCLDSIDANDDGSLDISDAIRMLGALFLQQPWDEYGNCVLDFTPDTLECETYDNCP